MPLDPFHGNTFVAFTDIAGFKPMMKDPPRAARALDALYSGGYHALNEQGLNDVRVSGLFVSDCGILYVSTPAAPAVQLEQLCKAVRQLNRSCFSRAVTLTTSIAYGDFSYQQRIEFHGIEKNMFAGSAYLSAYLDQAGGEPKLYAPEARILKASLPDDALTYCSSKLGMGMRDERSHFYFEWMLEGQA